MDDEREDDEPEDGNQFEHLMIHDGSTTTPAGKGGKAAYEIRYELGRDDTAIEVDFENLDHPDASESFSSGERTGTLSHEPSFGDSDHEDRYTITITVTTEDGSVLQREIVRDTADGTDSEI